MYRYIGLYIKVVLRVNYQKKREPKITYEKFKRYWYHFIFNIFFNKMRSKIYHGLFL